jgi:hypothetical protein
LTRFKITSLDLADFSHVKEGIDIRSCHQTAIVAIKELDKESSALLISEFLFFSQSLSQSLIGSEREDRLEELQTNSFESSCNFSLSPLFKIITVEEFIISENHMVQEPLDEFTVSIQADDLILV